MSFKITGSKIFVHINFLICASWFEHNILAFSIKLIGSLSFNLFFSLFNSKIINSGNNAYHLAYYYSILNRLIIFCQIINLLFTKNRNFMIRNIIYNLFKYFNSFIKQSFISVFKELENNQKYFH